jgi:hypothetical protein
VTAPLELLAQAAPDWFVAQAQDAQRLVGTARVEPWLAPGLELAIRAAASPTVGEAVPGTLLPKACPERHIQGDQTFCLGLRRSAITTLKAAEVWWSDLSQFLACQAIAQATGLWPPRNALDHGEAGGFHLRALQVAQRLDVEEAYWEAYFGQPSWITSTGLGLLGERGRVGARRLRKPKTPRGHTERNLLLELVIAERRRRRAMARYRQYAKTCGVTCCGGMRECAYPQ